MNPVDNILGITVQCQKCGHMWNTRSELYRITCPSCLNKVYNPAAKWIPK